MIPAIVTQRLLTASVDTAIAAIVVMLVATMLTRRYPRLLAMLWLVVLAKPLLTLVGVGLIPLPVSATFPTIQRIRQADEVTRGVRDGAPVEEVRERVTSRAPADAIVGIWLTGMALMLARTVRDRLRLRSVIRGSVEATARLRDALARSAGARVKTPALRISDALDGPAIAGVLNPVILLPRWMEQSGDEPQLEWALRHELRHATAHDTLGILLREVSLIVLWFHPGVWLAAHRWESATEQACDRDVVQSDAAAVDYAEALVRTLLNVRRQRRLHLATGLFATRSKIGARIAALIERPLAPPAGRAAIFGTLVLAFALIAVGARSAQGRHRGHIEEVDDERSLTMDYDAGLGFDGVSGAIEIAPGGWVNMRETRNGVIRTLRLDSRSGATVRTYAVSGRTAHSDESASAFEKRMAAQLRRATR